MPGSAAMVLLSAPPEPTGRRGGVAHADYLIDRFRVAYQFGGGWTCGCADFAAADACRHTREAAGRLAAQMRIIEHIKKGSLDPLRGDHWDLARGSARGVDYSSADADAPRR